MRITKVVSQVTAGLLCAVLLFGGLPLNAASSSEELRHEAFLRGGQAIAVALTASAENAVVSKAIEAEVPAALPAPAPVPAKRQAGKSGGMHKGLWAALIGGFAVSGYIVYWAATGPGASVRNCSSANCKN